MKAPILAACLMVVPLGLLAGPARQTTPAARQASHATATSNQQNPGERVFQNNCSRCHQAPMGLSPRITGTVITHMRTRARLSRQDEERLLKYLAP